MWKFTLLVQEWIIVHIFSTEQFFYVFWDKHNWTSLFLGTNLNLKGVKKTKHLKLFSLRGYNSYLRPNLKNLSLGLNPPKPGLETFDTILSGTNHILRHGLNLSRRSNSLNSASDHNKINIKMTLGC